MRNDFVEHSFRPLAYVIMVFECIHLHFSAKDKAVLREQASNPTEVHSDAKVTHAVVVLSLLRRNQAPPPGRYF